MLKLEEIRDIYINEINKDLEKVNSWIDNIKSNLNELEIKKKQNNNLFLEERYKKLMYEYYLEKAKSFICDINMYKDNMNVNCEFIFQNQKYNPLNTYPPFYIGSIYSSVNFPYKNWIYDGCCNPNRIPIFSIRFGQLSAYDFENIKSNLQKIYSERNNSDAYFNFCEWYIEDYVLPLLKENLNDNYFLYSNKDALEHFLGLYYNKDYRSIAHVLPPLIEGLIHDICASLGLKSVFYEKVSFTESIKYMAEKVSKTYLYEYFLFKFPIMRNKISHGRNIGLNFKEVGIHFILDISSLISLVKNENIPINKVFSLVSSPSLEKIKKLKDIDYSLLPEPVKKEYQKIGNYLITEKFLTELKNDINTSELKHKKTEKTCKFILSNSYRFAHSKEVEKIFVNFLKNTLPNIKKELIKEKEKVDSILVLLKK